MVGIIIINYKDYANRFLADCRDSLRTQSFQEEKVRFYIVDNASSKESRISLKDNFQEAVILPRSDGDYFFSSRRRHTRLVSDWSSDVCSSDLKFTPKNVRHCHRDSAAGQT